MDIAYSGPGEFVAFGGGSEAAILVLPDASKETTPVYDELVKEMGKDVVAATEESK